VFYLLSLPVGWKSYRDHQRRAAAQSAATTGVAARGAAGPLPLPAAETEPDDRPARLN
jgi:CDP-diacylglycerol--serine O-phosphatidyltransferase